MESRDSYRFNNFMTGNNLSIFAVPVLYYHFMTRQRALPKTA